FLFPGPPDGPTFAAVGGEEERQCRFGFDRGVETIGRRIELVLLVTPTACGLPDHVSTCRQWVGRDERWRRSWRRGDKEFFVTAVASERDLHPQESVFAERSDGIGFLKRQGLRGL